jgi:hypothetical protein
MSSEAEIIIAFLYKRSGKTALKESELYLPLSIELGWFTNQEARNFVTYAKQQNLLQEKNQNLIPNFDIHSITIPIGFYPSKQQYTKKSPKPTSEEKPISQQLINDIIKATQKTPKQVESDIQKIAKERHILPELSALYLATTHYIPIKQYFLQIEQQLFYKK